MQIMAVHDEVARILRELAPEKCRNVELDERVRLVGDLGLDSINLLRLLSELEKRYDIELFGASAGPQSYETIGALSQMILDRMK